MEDCRDHSASGRFPVQRSVGLGHGRCNDRPGQGHRRRAGLWKIWTEDSRTGRAGRIYLFASAEAAKAYADKHLPRLDSFGIEGIVAHHFGVTERLSDITHFKAPQ